MYFLIQLMSFYLPVDLVTQPETRVNPVHWKAGLPSLEDFKRRATEAVRKSADDLLKESKPSDEADKNPSPTTSSEPAPSSSRPVTTSADILPITLPLYQGLPISHVWHRLQTNSVDPMNIRQTNMLRWLMLMHVAKQPKLLENNRDAAIVAAANLPSAQWPEYLFCGYTASHCDSLVKSLNNQPVLGHGSTTTLKAWKGKNHEEQDRSHRAFVERYGKLLAGQSSALPQDIYVVAEASLDPILANTGGIPIRSPSFLQPASRVGDPRHRLPLAGNYSATVPNRLPETLQCSASRCTEILDATRIQAKSGINSYPVYLLTKVKLNSVQGSNINPSSPESQATILGDIEVYADKGLTKKLHQFDSLAQRSASAPTPVPPTSAPDKHVAARQNRPGSVDDFANAYYQQNKGGPWQESSVNADYLLANPDKRYASVLRLCIFRGYAAIKLVSKSGKEAVVGCIGSSEQEIDNNVSNAIQTLK